MTVHPMSVLARQCACGCGKRAPEGRRYVPSHRYGHTRTHGHVGDDDRAVAYYTGVIDARHGRPRRVDLADTSTIGAAYTRGYDAAAGLPATWSRATIAVAVAAVTGAAILTSRPDKDRP